jgi:hypothetical protein
MVLVVALGVLAAVPSTGAGALPLPLLASDNVELVNTFPETQAISGEFSQSSAHFYVSTLDGVSVFDVSDPRSPRLTDTLPIVMFENESMTHGERADGTKFVIVADDLYTIPVTDLTKADPCCGRRLLIIDVSDPTNMFLRSIVPVSTSSHTAQCVSLTCEFVYSAGHRGKFSIVDLRNLDLPKEAKVAQSPASAGDFAAGHYWDIDDAGIAWHTGGGGMAAFDITDPLNPVVLNATDANGTTGPWNNFILHNSRRPNATAFAPSTDPAGADISNGNVALVTEEDYDSVSCDSEGDLEEGSFETWFIPSLDVATYTGGVEPNGGTITPLDRYNTTVIGTDTRTPAGAFCSGHWFDVHQDGFVAQGFYQQGLRLLDVRDAHDIKEFGYVFAGASEVWDAYWVPARDADGQATGEQTNLVYTADLIRGIDVFEVDLDAEADPVEESDDREAEEDERDESADDRCDSKRKDGDHRHRHPGDDHEHGRAPRCRS